MREQDNQGEDNKWDENKKERRVCVLLIKYDVGELAYFATQLIVTR